MQPIFCYNSIFLPPVASALRRQPVCRIGRADKAYLAVFIVILFHAFGNRRRANSDEIFCCCSFARARSLIEASALS
jgi:hypothetical protein